MRIKITDEFEFIMPDDIEHMDLRLILETIEEQILLRYRHLHDDLAAYHLKISPSTYKRKLDKYRIKKENDT